MNRFLGVLLILISSITLAAKEGTFKVVGEFVRRNVVEHEGYLENSKITVVNTSDTPVYLVWETVSNTFPKAWDCSMCQHGKCQIGIPRGSIFKQLNPGEEGFIAIHVLPQAQAGSGCVKFKIYDKARPAYFRILTFYVQVM